MWFERKRKLKKKKNSQTWWRQIWTENHTKMDHQSVKANAQKIWLLGKETKETVTQSVTIN